MRILIPRGIYTPSTLQDTIRLNMSDPVDNEIFTMDSNDTFVGCEQIFYELCLFILLAVFWVI